MAEIESNKINKVLEGSKIFEKVNVNASYSNGSLFSVSFSLWFYENANKIIFHERNFRAEITTTWNYLNDIKANLTSIGGTLQFETHQEYVDEIVRQIQLIFPGFNATLFSTDLLAFLDGLTEDGVFVVEHESGFADADNTGNGDIASTYNMLAGKYDLFDGVFDNANAYEYDINVISSPTEIVLDNETGKMILRNKQ